ncbi:methyltransferase [Candidatus Woesearchaeota archaeon]|nr:methyltransferase [Candidatus Woesearchaeota archaeon]
MYEPAEDSYLLQKYVSIFAEGRVLDLGTGSGIQALTAIKNPQVREVVAIDIDEESIRALITKQEREKLRKLTIEQGDLFSGLKGQFNVIIFNPPYLPQDKVAGKIIEDKALYGGKKGWEISERFFQDVSKYLLPEGRILFLFSSLTNKKKIESLINEHLLVFKELSRGRMAFEELYIYSIDKNPVLRKLEALGIESIGYFSKGSRGKIYRGLLDYSKLEKKSLFRDKSKIKEVVIKLKRVDSKAESSLQDEARWLKIANDSGIGPKILWSDEDYVVMERIEGQFIIPWIEISTKKDVALALEDVLRQCFILDGLGISKEEMHRPLKHIIIRGRGDFKPKVTLLDFERSRQTEKPQNVTQFVEFICRTRKELEKKGWKLDLAKLRVLASEYKKESNKEKRKECLEKIINCLNN